MKNFIFGFILGAVTFGAIIVYADIGVLYDTLNQPFGTSENPIYITTD